MKREHRMPLIRGASIPVLLFCLTLLSPEAVHAQRSPESVVAGRGGANVTLADIDAFAQTIPESDRANFFNNPRRIESMINNMLLSKQLATLAREQGLDKSPEVEAAPESSREALLGKLEMRRFREEIVVPDLSQLAREKYMADKEAYGAPAVLDVKHILVSTTSRSEQEARTLAEQLEADIRKNPERFDELLEAHSDDPNKAENHGLIHDAGDKRYTEPFAEAARALMVPGEISAPVKTDYGFHILKLIEKAPAQPRSFEEAKADIVAALSKEYVTRQTTLRIDVLRNMPLDADPDLVASLRTRYGVVARVPRAERGESKPAGGESGKKPEDSK